MARVSPAPAAPPAAACFLSFFLRCLKNFRCCFVIFCGRGSTSDVSTRRRQLSSNDSSPLPPATSTTPFPFSPAALLPPSPACTP
eukprot:COSAG04_NODE_1358_length_7102_cov_9.598601_1_plen_84_part_10